MRRILTRRDRGYSLVEVLIAMGLMAVVMLSIVTLFFAGRKNVYSGRQMTHAVSIGTRIMEDLSAMSVPTIYQNFGITNTTTLGTVTVTPSSMTESSYARSISRSTTSVATAGTCTGATLITFSNDANNWLRNWYCQMNSTSNQLTNGQIWLVFTPRNPNPVGATLDPANATVVRIRAIVRWQEAGRNRQMILDLTKTARPLG